MSKLQTSSHTIFRLDLVQLPKFNENYQSEYSSLIKIKGMILLGPFPYTKTQTKEYDLSMVVCKNNLTFSVES